MKKSETSLNRKITKYLLLKHILRQKQYQWDMFYDIFLQEGKLREFRKLELQPFVRVDRIVEINIYRLVNIDSITYLIIFPDWNQKNKKDLVYYFMRTLGEFFSLLNKDFHRDLKRIDIVTVYPEGTSERIDDQTKQNIKLLKENVLTEYRKPVELNFMDLILPNNRRMVDDLVRLFETVDEQFKNTQITQSGIRALFDHCVSYNIFRDLFLNKDRYKLSDEILAYLSFSSEIEYLT